MTIFDSLSYRLTEVKQKIESDFSIKTEIIKAILENGYDKMTQGNIELLISHVSKIESSLTIIEFEIYKIGYNLDRILEIVQQKDDMGGRM